MQNSFGQEQRSVILPESVVEEAKADPVGASLYITDIGYYPVAAGHYRKREDGCKQHILIYCVAGKGWISVNGAKKYVQENQFFIIPKDVPHAYASDSSDPWSIYWVHFAGDHAHYFSGFSDKTETISPSDTSRINDRIQLFYEMLRNLEMGYGVDNIRYANICLLHFLASFRYVDQFRNVRTLKDAGTVEASILFMKEHLAAKLTLSALADQAQLSVSRYSTLFREKTGRPPLEYLINLRIQQACQLLDHTSLKVSDIARKIGYDDQYYFSRLFSKIMGQAPREYRKRLKG